VGDDMAPPLLEACLAVGLTGAQACAFYMALTLSPVEHVLESVVTIYERDSGGRRCWVQGADTHAAN
jgi:tRNA A37 threonylcarbamoyltransferase TsaD